jgi:hypothetical protein
MVLRRHVGRLGLAAALLLLPGVARARTETIRWTYSDPSRVTAFRIHLGASSGSYTSMLEVGKPTPSGGVYSVAVTVSDTQVVYSAVSAYNATQTSPLSNERRLDPPAAPPPPDPPPDPPPPPPDDPPPGAATWSSTFDGYAAGDDPAGWVDTRANNSMSTDDSLFGVVTLGGDPAFSTASTDTNIHSHFVTSESVHWSAYEFSGRMRMSDPNGGIGVTALSQYPSQDAYYRLRRQQGSGVTAFHLAPHPDGKAVSCASASTGVTPSANQWYRFRLQVVAESGQTLVKAKVWAQGASEPGSWQIDCTDTAPDRLVEGEPGVWSMGPGAKYWDDLQVTALAGSGSGGPSPVPAAPILFGP